MDQVILFDLDGTIVDNTEHIRENFRYALSKLGQPHDSVRIDTILGRSFSKIKGILALTDHQLDEFIRHYKDYDFREDRELRMISGMEDLLQTLKKNSLKLGIVTSKIDETAYYLVEKFNLFSYFDVVITANNVQKTKPDPEGLILACHHFSRSPSSAFFYVGDSLSDIDAAFAAGLTPIGVSWGVAGEKIKEKILEGSSHYVENVRQLAEILVPEIGF